jgi:hypothetical protein
MDMSREVLNVYSHWCLSLSCLFDILKSTMQPIFYILCPLSTKDSDCYLTRCSIRAAGDEVTSETTKNTQSMDQRKASKRPAQLAMFTGLYIAVVGMALLIYPTKLFGKTSKHFKACEFRDYKSMIQQ